MIAGAHGVKGDVRLRSFTENPEAIAAYKPLTDESGARDFKVTLKGSVNNYFIASLPGVADREAAEALRGARLYVPRAALPKTRKRQYYQADLIGLSVRDESGAGRGTVLAVHDYGAGVFLEIGAGKSGFMLPFNDNCVPEVDLKGGHIMIVPPKGWLS